MATKNRPPQCGPTPLPNTAIEPTPMCTLDEQSVLGNSEVVRRAQSAQKVDSPSVLEQVGPSEVVNAVNWWGDEEKTPSSPPVVGTASRTKGIASTVRRGIPQAIPDVGPGLPGWNAALAKPGAPVEGLVVPPRKLPKAPVPKVPKVPDLPKSKRRMPGKLGVGLSGLSAMEGAKSAYEKCGQGDLEGCAVDGAGAAGNAMSAVGGVLPWVGKAGPLARALGPVGAAVSTSARGWSRYKEKNGGRSPWDDVKAGYRGRRTRWVTGTVNAAWTGLKTVGHGIVGTGEDLLDLAKGAMAPVEGRADFEAWARNNGRPGTCAHPHAPTVYDGQGKRKGDFGIGLPDRVIDPQDPMAAFRPEPKPCSGCHTAVP